MVEEAKPPRLSDDSSVPKTGAVVYSNACMGYSIVLFGVLILSLDALMIDEVKARGLDDWALLFYRYLLSTSAVFFAMNINPYDGGPSNIPAKFKSIGFIGVYASCFWAFASIMYTLAIESTHVANVMIIMATTSLWTAILSSFLFNEVLPLRLVVAIVVSFLAVSIVVGLSMTLDEDWEGNLCAVSVCRLDDDRCIVDTVISHYSLSHRFESQHIAYPITSHHITSQRDRIIPLHPHLTHPSTTTLTHPHPTPSFSALIRHFHGLLLRHHPIRQRRPASRPDRRHGAVQRCRGVHRRHRRGLGVRRLQGTLTTTESRVQLTVLMFTAYILTTAILTAVVLTVILTAVVLTVTLIAVVLTVTLIAVVLTVILTAVVLTVTLIAVVPTATLLSHSAD